MGLFAWMFFLGIMVGRGSVEISLYPTDLQQEMMAESQRQDVVRSQEGGDPEQPEEAPASVELSFYKQVKQSEELVTKRRQVTKLEVRVVAPNQVGKAPVVPKSKVAEPSKRSAPVKAPKLSPPSDSSGYTIQVAAHAERAAAEKELSQLTSNGFSGYIVSVKAGDGRTWYRVRVGHYTNKDAALKELSRLAAVKKSAYVVKL